MKKYSLIILIFIMFVCVADVKASFEDSTLYGTSSLKAYYKLENTDDETTNYDFTNFNSVEFNTAKYGLGADFGQSNNNKILAVNSDLALSYNQNMTVSLWFKLLSEVTFSDCYTIMQLNYIDNPGTYKRIQYCDGIYAAEGVKTLTWTTNSSITRNGSLNDSQFHHIVWTSSSSIEAWLDGELIGIDSGFTGNYSARGDWFSIGALKNTVDSLYHGDLMIDDVVVLGSYITPTEINDIYTAEGSTQQPEATSTVISGEIDYYFLYSVFQWYWWIFVLLIIFTFLFLIFRFFYNLI